MASDPPRSEAAAGGSNQPPQGLRTAVSLFLFIHLFCIFAGLSTTLTQSPLQGQLLVVLRPYTQLLNFDVSFVPYYLTHGTRMDVDHTVEVLPKGKDAEELENWIVLPDAGTRCGERYKRYQRLAQTLGFYADDQGISGLLATSVGSNMLHQGNMEPAKIRCRRHLLQRMEWVESGTAEQRNPFDPLHYQTVYTANAVVGADGNVRVVKQDAEGQIARPTSEKE